MSGPVYELCIELRGISPAIWRRFRVPSDVDLEQLHKIIQAVMGWEDAHLFAFRKGKTMYADERLEGEWKPRAREARVADVLPKPGDTLEYMYDFGDSWEHQITLLESLDPSVPAPVCLDGARACPPEDCGGVPGYHEMLEILADPTHEFHEEMSDWIGGHYDPEAFTLPDVGMPEDSPTPGRSLPPHSIAGVIAAFLEDESHRLARTTLERYERSLSPLLYAINSYRPSSATSDADRLGGKDRPFVEVVGMDILLGYLPEYFDYFLPRKEFATKDDLANLRAVLRRLVAWMAETGRMDEGDALEWRRRIADMASRGIEAARIRWMTFEETPPPLPPGDVEEFIEDYFYVKRVEPKRLWIDHPEDARDTLEMEVTRELSDLCKPGMDLALTLIKIRGEWHLAEVFNAYPTNT